MEPFAAAGCFDAVARAGRLLAGRGSRRSRRDLARAEALDCRGGEAGLEALVADQHERAMVTGELDIAVWAGRIQPPLAHVASHDLTREPTPCSEERQR